MDEPKRNFRSLLPRWYEFLDLAKRSASGEWYFQDFERQLRLSLALEMYSIWEKKFEQLDCDAWSALQAEALQYVSCKHPRRAWQQLFDILGQVDAYIHLKTMGCSTVVFIPRTDQRTPDLKGQFHPKSILCEVKTINTSDAEFSAREQSKVVSGADRILDSKFFGKLQSVIDAGRRQLDTYDPPREARHLVYIRIAFDDWVGYSKEDNLEQIDGFLAAHPTPDIEVFISREQA